MREVVYYFKTGFLMVRDEVFYFILDDFEDAGGQLDQFIYLV